MPSSGPVPGLPPIEIKPSRMVALYLGTFLAIPVLVAFVPPLVQGDGVGGSDLGSALGMYAALLIVGGGTAAFMLRAQSRTRVRLLADAPAGTVIATLARPLEVVELDAPRRMQRFSGWSNGILVVGADGVSFRKKETAPAAPEVRFGWAEIERVETERENPFRLYLRVHTRTRQVHAWQVPGAHVVEAALRGLRDGPTC